MTTLPCLVMSCAKGDHKLITHRKEVNSMKLVAPSKKDYRKILGVLKAEPAMNLKCGACASCTGSPQACK